MFDQKGFWLKINPKIKVQEGVVTWYSLDQTASHLYFSLEGDRKTGGYLKAQFDDSPSSFPLNQFMLKAYSQLDGMYMEWNCHALQCSSLSRLTKLLFSELEAWKVFSGILEGQVMAVFPKNQKPYLEGEITVQDLAFAQVASYLQGAVQEAKLTLQKSSQMRAKNHWPFSVQGQIEILQPATLACFRDEKLCWQLDHILGKMGLNEAKIASLAFDIQSFYQDRHSDFHLEGEVNLDPESTVNVATHLLCRSQGQPAGGEVRLLLHQLPNTSKIAEVECKKLSYIEWGLLQALLVNYWPSMQHIAFHEGLGNALIHAELTSKGLEIVQFQQVQIQNLTFEILPYHTSFHFHEWAGYGSIDLASPDIWHSLNAELHMENGQMIFKNLDSTDYSFTDIQTHLCLSKGDSPLFS